MAFPALARSARADELEQRLLARWKEEGLFQQTLEANRGGPPFVFYEGPPTANGRPGIHHVFARTIKDLVCRFHAMQGQAVTRIAGWDTHGLPVEIEVEKELKLNGKKAIEAFGVAGVQRAAPARASSSTRRDWEALSDRIGYWLDYEHPYVTCSNDYIESVWWLLAAAARAATCSTADTGCCRTARAAARCSRATSWRWATRRSRPTRST